VKVYALATTLTDGVPGRSYTQRVPGEWWARLEPPTGREKTTGLAGEHTISAVCTLATEAVVGETDVLTDEGGVIYEVRAVLPRQLLAEQEVWLERSSQAQNTYTLVDA
jgi:hypothetical protein